MIVAFVKHENQGRPFLFEIDNPSLDIDKGDTVICDTRYGEAKGVVLTIIRLTGDPGPIADACRATLPLKKVLRKYIKPVVTSINEVPAEIVEQIRQQEIRKIISQLSAGTDMPFLY